MPQRGHSTGSSRRSIPINWHAGPREPIKGQGSDEDRPPWMHVQRATPRRRRYVEQPDNRVARRGAGLRTVLSARTLVDGTGTARRTIGVMNGSPWSTERALRAQQGAGCLPQAASAWSCRCQHRTREHADRSIPAGCAPDDSPVWRSGPLHWSAGTCVRLDASRPASHGSLLSSTSLSFTSHGLSTGGQEPVVLNAM